MDDLKFTAGQALFAVVKDNKFFVTTQKPPIMSDDVNLAGACVYFLGYATSDMSILLDVKLLNKIVCLSH